MEAPDELPSGMVTFVFTDIEGSTRLFRRVGERYVSLLERHHVLLRDAWRAHDGIEVNTEGDAFFVAFVDAADAIEACATAQRALAAEPWPPDAEIRVRMGVHTGLAYPRGGDYIAFAVHQAARVVSAANGHQILVSAQAAERATNLQDIELSALGRFQVQDFDEPVSLFTVSGEGLPRCSEPLRVLPADRHNLVRPITSVVGRAEDLADLASRMAGSRLVSIVGPGGLGKTRLVIEYGLAHAGEFEHGIWFVHLAPLTEASGFAEAVAAGVATPLTPGVDVWAAVINHLRDRETVIIMDNCEHIGVEAARRIGELLHACPRTRVLATSREPLGLRGEAVWRPEPLAIASSAVELFFERAGIVDPEPATRAAAIELCERLDGLPLAIELAAARADVLTPGEIVTLLDAQHSLPSSRDPTLDPRQRSLDEMIDWSYELLTDAEQRAFRRLGVFASGFDLEAATAAIAYEDLDQDQVPELVWSLLSKSLLINDVGAGSTRYRMLATVKYYARRLGAGGELVRTSTHLANHYLSTIGPQVDKLDQALISDRARELDNLRALIPLLALDDVGLAQTLAVTVVYTVNRSSPNEATTAGLQYIEDLQGETTTYPALLIAVCTAAINSGKHALGADLLTRAGTMMTDGSSPDWIDGRLHQQRGIIAIAAQNPSLAAEIAREGLDTVRTAQGRSYMLGLTGIAATDRGDMDGALSAFREALTIDQERGNLVSMATQFGNIAELDLRAGRLQAAAHCQLEGLDLALALGLQREVTAAWIVAARIAASTRAWEPATRLQSAADAEMGRIGQSLYPTDRALSDDLLANAAIHLGRTRYDAELVAGAQLTLEEAILEARAILAAASS